jgi:ribonuclease HI
MEENLELAKERLRRSDSFDFVVYTDGSVGEGQVNGGAACVVTTGPPEDPVEVVRAMRPAGKYASSYQAEMKALCLALQCLLEREGEWSRALVVSDSRSGLQSIARFRSRPGNRLVEEDFRLLADLCEKGRETKFVWVPAHCGLRGNEWADQWAGEAAEMVQTGVGWLYKTAIVRLWSGMRPKTFAHESSRLTYSAGGVREDKEALLSK